MNQATGTILIVDDTKLNLEIMKALLQSEYAILTASNGLEGLLLAQTEKIDLSLDVVVTRLKPTKKYT